MKTGYMGSILALAIALAVPHAAEAGQVEITGSGNAPQTEAPDLLGGCPAEVVAFHRCAMETAETFEPPRTPEGRPDMGGFWRSRLTQAYSVEGVDGSEPLVGDLVMPWTISPAVVIDPADGNIPYQPWAAPIGRLGRNYDDYIDPRTACGPGGVPRLALQDSSQILQPWGDDQILWLHEDHHINRIVSMDDDGPALAENIKLWQGDSRGHWEGNTLVIDVTNLNGYTWMDDAGNFYSDTAHLVERLTLVDADTIHYEVTVEDPNVFTQPWTVVWALTRIPTPGFELLEEACWEGERDLPRILEEGYKHYFGDPWKTR
jgi:hypothetical protein